MKERLDTWVPLEVFDAHVHLLREEQFLPEEPPGHFKGELGEFQAAAERLLFGWTCHGLFFGFPSKSNDSQAINAWVRQELQDGGSGRIRRALAMVRPHDNPGDVEALLDGKPFVGLSRITCTPIDSRPPRRDLRNLPPNGCGVFVTSVPSPMSLAVKSSSYSPSN